MRQIHLWLGLHARSNWKALIILPDPLVSWIGQANI